MPSKNNSAFIKRHSRLTLIAYGLPALPLAAILLPAFIYLPTFYAEDLALGLAVVGMIRLVSGFFDVLTDPLIGMMSDRSKFAMGRRKFFVLFGVPFTMLGTWMLMVPTGNNIDYVYMLTWSCVMYLGWTMMYLPLTALSTELTLGYHERSRLAAYREGFTAIGILFTLGMISYMGLDGYITNAQATKAIAIFVCATLPLATAIFMWKVPDPCPKKCKKKIGFYKGLKIMKSNRPFRILIFSYLLNAFANGLPAILIILFVENIISGEEHVGPYLLAYFLSGLVGLPVWVKLAKRIGKHKSWCIAMVWACLVFAFIPFVGEGDTVLFMTISILTGFAVGADLALPSSMQADVIDVDYAETGEQRSGLYFALWGMMTKLSLTFAAGIAFLLLDWVNWPEESNYMIYTLYAGVPVFIKIGLVLKLWRYPLDRDELSKVHKKIAKMTKQA